MIAQTSIYILEDKGINKVTSKKDGNQYDLKTLFLKDETGAITTLVVNNYIYDKVNVGGKYKVKVLLDNNGKLSVNDLELQK